VLDRKHQLRTKHFAAPMGRHARDFTWCQNLTYCNVDQLLPILAGRHPRRLHASLQLENCFRTPQQTHFEEEIVCVNFQDEAGDRPLPESASIRGRQFWPELTVTNPTPLYSFL